MPEAIGQVGYRGSRGIARSDRPRATPKALMAFGHLRLVSRLMYCIIALYALTFAQLSILQHDSHNTNAFDLGNMDQAVWNTFNGRPFEFSNWEGGRSRLAAHVEPILIPISQLYRFFSTPKTLLVLQAVVISLGALPAFWFARDRLRNDFAALTFASAYLLAPELEAATLADFHPVALATSFLTFAFYFMWKKTYWAFAIFAILAMMTKEQIPISIALMGVYIIVVQRKPKVGIPVIAVAAVYFLVAFYVVIPLNNPTKASPYLSRYDQYGSSPIEVLRTLFSDPAKALPEKAIPLKLNYVRELFAPVAFLAWLSPLTLLPALPDLAINLLSGFEAMYSGGAHYSAVIVPFVIIASIDGLALLATLLARFAMRLVQPVIYLLSANVLLLSVWSYYQSVVLPLTDNFPIVTDHNRLLSEILPLIPSDASVSAATRLNPHVSQRQRLYLFPDFADADYVLLDVTSSPHPLDDAALHWRATGLLNGGEWGWIAAKDGYLLLKRGEESRPLPPEFFTFTRPTETTIDRPVRATFGSGVQLLGYSLEPGDVLHQRDGGARIRLYMRVTDKVSKDYLVGVVALANGQTISSQYWFPTTLWMPMTKWPTGEIMAVDIPRVALAGQPWVDVFVSIHEPRENNQPGVKLPLRVDQAAAFSDVPDAEENSIFLVRLRGEYW